MEPNPVSSSKDAVLDNEDSPEQLHQQQPSKVEPTEDLVAQRLARCRTQTAGTELDLSDLGLHDLPFEVLTTLSSSLKKLTIRKNKLTRLPEELARQLPHLTVLNASDNELTELPEQMGFLRNLQRLILENNRLATLPKSFSKLSALEELNLRSNALERLDEDLGSHFPKLKTLLLGNNATLSAIPRSLGNLPALRIVDLSGNGELTFVPEKIRRLHERNLILHSRAKRRELISRALRVRSVVTQNLSTPAMVLAGK